MSVEVLSKNTADVFNAIIRKPNWDKLVLQEAIQKVLLQARDSVSSPEAYLESLIGNVTFQYAYTNASLSFLSECIEEEKFVSPESFQEILANVPTHVRESNFLAENMPRFKEIVYRGSSFEEQVVHAQGIYFHSKFVNDLLVEFIGTFLHPENRSFMGNFMEYASQVVVDTVMHYSQTYASHMLDELNSLNSTKEESSSLV
ncbi:hypothetical protein [Neobacillus dielmonensis]|uniref:hypothetical protein n=1 Tax=Neobacillus dielmonensis TaxID=1347369 RepID=UPI0005A854B0|nr:hypothetical protein [Neobacillus dielmonensis]